MIPLTFLMTAIVTNCSNSICGWLVIDGFDAQWIDNNCTCPFRTECVGGDMKIQNNIWEFNCFKIPATEFINIQNFKRRMNNHRNTDFLRFLNDLNGISPIATSEEELYQINEMEEIKSKEFLENQ